MESFYFLSFPSEMFLVTSLVTAGVIMTQKMANQLSWKNRWNLCRAWIMQQRLKYI